MKWRTDSSPIAGGTSSDLTTTSGDGGRGCSCGLDRSDVRRVDGKLYSVLPLPPKRRQRE